MTGYSTGAGNRLLSDGNFNYTYDADGNMLTKAEIATGNVTTYTWDYRNRLTSVTVKDANNNVIQQSNYTYDPFDRRIGTSFDPDGAGPQPAVQTKTVWDGLNPFADFNGSGALTNRYLERAAAVDQVMASFSATGLIGWHLADQLGSVRDIADQNGNVQDHVKYDSFGKVLSESNPANGDRFKFTGRELDGTGDYNYRARYYNPAIGRFTSEDPTGLGGGDTNVFRYTGNSPTTAVDPTGLADYPAKSTGADLNNPAYAAWLNQHGWSGGSGGAPSTPTLLAAAGPGAGEPVAAAPAAPAAAPAAPAAALAAQSVYVIQRPLALASSPWAQDIANLSTEVGAEVGGWFGPWGAMIGAGAGLYAGEVGSYYVNNTFHGELAVAPNVQPVVDKNGNISQFAGINQATTWDFQAKAGNCPGGTLNPAWDFQQNVFPSQYYPKASTSVIQIPNASAQAVTQAANNTQWAAADYRAGGNNLRRNCVDWLVSVLGTAKATMANGQPYTNQNPQPFGDKPAPWWVPSSAIGWVLDKR